MKNIIAGIRYMADGVFAFAWFALAARLGWKIAESTGWMAALYFALFAGSAAYGTWCLFELGKRSVKVEKKGERK